MILDPRADVSDPLKPSADPGGRIGGFHELMRWRVDNILLVSSLYDSFILAEGGHVSEVVLGEFLGLNLYNIPDIRRVSTGGDALDLMDGDGSYDLIVASPRIGDMDVGELARRLHEAGTEIPVVLLSYDEGELQRFTRRHDLSEVFRAFLWQGDIRILFAIVKHVEDRKNVAHDVELMGVPAIIVIEDSIRYYSSFLPLIYAEVMQHTRSLIPDGLNISHQLQRIKARPKILLCDTYEEAWHYFSTYEENILGVISDIEFPKGGELCPDAGVEFAREVQRRRDDVPVVLHSGREENEKMAREAGAAFLLKGSPTLLGELRQFMLDNFGFGDFVFRTPGGEEVGRAHDLKSLEEMIREVPGESLAYHGRRNHFSVWLKAHTEFGIAHRLRPRKVSEFASHEDLRRYLIEAIHRHREQRTRAVVTDYDPTTFSPERGFARIGGGSLGGKARGLAFADVLLTEYELEGAFPDVRIHVPPCVVVATDVFDDFLERNGLVDLAIKSRDDTEIVRRFLEGRFSEETEEALRSFIDEAGYPLAVRSSSLLEDSKYQPFAGIYETLMLPNDDPDPEVRLERLARAIKRVYASTFSRRAKRHTQSTQYRLEEEKMAVILQRLIGSVHEDRFYPDFAGVAMSRNFYPTGRMKAEDGIVAVALGLGPTVVEGETCLRFCPRYPEHVLQLSSVKDALENTQSEFYALQLEAEEEPDDEPGARLRRHGLEVAEKDGALATVGSTYSPENDAIYDGISRSGNRLVTFAPILKHDVFPLPEITERLMEICAHATGVPVEIEFAVRLASRGAAGPGEGGSREGEPPSGDLHEFGFLQLRPVARGEEVAAAEIGEIDPEAVICHSTSVLGNGVIDDVRDLVIIDYYRYDRADSRQVAQRVTRFNAELEDDRTPYILIGVGRWGSSEPYLGIPVVWEQISGARAIVEAGFRDFRVTPSQGTHLFQNLIAHNVGYFTVNPEVGEGFVDWDWLAEQPAVRESGAVRHLRFEEPVTVKMDGNRNAGVILKPGVSRAT